MYFNYMLAIINAYTHHFKLTNTYEHIILRLDDVTTKKKFVFVYALRKIIFVSAEYSSMFSFINKLVNVLCM